MQPLKDRKLARLYGPNMASEMRNAMARLNDYQSQDDIFSTVPFPQYADRPVEFAQEILGIKQWDFQKYAMRAIWEKRFVTMASCHKAGKSHVLGTTALTFMMTCPCIVITYSPSKEHLTDVLWSEIRNQHAESRVPLPGKVDRTQLIFGAKHFAKGISTNKVERVHGRHAGVDMGDDPDEDLTEEEVLEMQRELMRAGKLVRLVYLIDETTGIDNEILEALKGSLSGANVYFALAANPVMDLSTNHEFAKSHRIPSLGYHRIHIASEECEHGSQTADKCYHHIPSKVLPQSWIDKHKDSWGEQSAVWKARGLGLFSGADSDKKVITGEMLRVQSLRKRPNISLGRHIGVDLSREGNDKSVASLFVDGLKSAQYQWEHARQYESASIIETLRVRWGKDGVPVPGYNVHIDSGKGEGAIDDLHSRGIYVDEVKFGARMTGDWEFLVGDILFKNRRAELHWVTRCGIDKGYCQIPEKYETSWEEAMWAEYDMEEKPDGLMIAIQKKVVLKELFGRSPDVWDADLLGFAGANPGGNQLSFGVLS